jgi:dTDP-glucose 4,6-dehydratase
MKTILITGGAGFIGSNFTNYLLKKYPNFKIIVLDALTYAGDIENLPHKNEYSDRFSFWYGNVRNAELVDTLISQSDIVIHFAAETHVTRSIYDNIIFFETDVLGTQTIANAILKHINKIERFIHISTSEVYGTALKKVIDENHPLYPMSPYASAKAGADRLVYSYWATYKIPAIIIRPFNTYGPFQHLEKVTPRFITSCILDEPLSIHGDGKSSRDWVFVEDLCFGIDKAMHKNIKILEGQVINLGSGRSMDIQTIAKLFLEKWGSPGQR